MGKGKAKSSTFHNQSNTEPNKGYTSKGGALKLKCFIPQSFLSTPLASRHILRCNSETLFKVLISNSAPRIKPANNYRRIYSCEGVTEFQSDSILKPLKNKFPPLQQSLHNTLRKNLTMFPSFLKFLQYQVVLDYL